MDKEIKKRRVLIKFPNSKKGISVMIGYVLLITFAVIIGAIIYQWIITYVPKESLACPDGVSIFADEITCNNGILSLTLKNNGRFNIAGYFIHATNTSEQELATIDLSPYVVTGASSVSNSVIFNWNENSMEPNEERKSIFNLPSNINSIEIIPVRFQEQDNRKRFVSCGNAKIKDIVNCVGEFFCGDGTCNPTEDCLNCEADCGVCTNDCGDGVIETPEDCDGEELGSATCASVMGDGYIGELSCKADCTFDTTACELEKRIIFVSSNTYEVAVDFNSIITADILCNDSANTAGLSGEFKAWLSDSSQDARNIIPDTDIPFYTTNDEKIADNSTDLLNGTIQNPINRDENKVLKDVSVFTGTDEFGYVISGQHCEEWTKNNKQSAIGNSSEKDLQWTKESIDADCGLLISIYCIQVN